MDEILQGLIGVAVEYDEIHISHHKKKQGGSCNQTNISRKHIKPKKEQQSLLRLKALYKLFVYHKNESFFTQGAADGSIGQPRS